MLAATCRLIAGLALLVSIPIDAYAQAPRVTLTEDDPRALSLMAQDIARRTRSTITFEELVYPDAGDWQFYPDKNPALPLPTHQPFTFTYSPQGAVSEILATLLAQFHQQSAGTYRVLEREGVFHILPAMSNDANGERVERTSILDLPVTVRLTRTTGEGVVCEVLRQLKERWAVDVACQTGIKGDVFGELGYAEYVEVDVSARDQLLRVRRDLSQPLSWNITHSAGRYGVHFFIQQWEP